MRDAQCALRKRCPRACRALRADGLAAPSSVDVLARSLLNGCPPGHKVNSMKPSRFIAVCIIVLPLGLVIAAHTARARNMNAPADNVIAVPGLLHELFQEWLARADVRNKMQGGPGGRIRRSERGMG
jgi:hypothetical protein